MSEQPWEKEQRQRLDSERVNAVYAVIEKLKALLAYTVPGAERTMLWEAIERVAMVGQVIEVRREREQREKEAAGE